MKISELQNNQTVIARIGRAGRTGVEWEKNPISNQEWNPLTLYVQKDPKGKLCIITLKDQSWAEASLNDFCPDSHLGGTFVVEDYYLQIANLEP